MIYLIHYFFSVQGFQCSYCNKFYPTENILRDHMRVHVFNYKCTLCDMSCVSPADLVKHIRYRHVSARPFPCQLCSHAAKSQQDLDSHMTVHTSGPNFICNYEGCSYTCKNAYVFDRYCLKMLYLLKVARRFDDRFSNVVLAIQEYYWATLLIYVLKLFHDISTVFG